MGVEFDRDGLISGMGFCMIGLLLFSGILLLRYSISPLVDTLGVVDTIVGISLVAYGVWKMAKSRRSSW